MENVGRDILMQEAMPQEVLGTVAGVVLAVPYLANLVAYATAPLLVEAIGPRHALVVCAIGVLAAVLALRVTLATRRRKPDTGPQIPARPDESGLHREHHHDLDAVESP